MAAAAQTSGTREVVEFPPNVPVKVALKYPTARMVTGAHGARAMFTTVDNRVLFLDLPVAREIEQAGIKTREEFSITRQTSGKRGEPFAWIVSRLAPTVGEQPDGTFAVPRDPEPERKPVQRAELLREGLIAEANALVDAYAAVLHRGLTEYQGRVKPDEIRALFLSAYIQRKQFSSVA